MRYTSHPYVAMASDVDEAYEIVRNSVRLQIAAYLIEHPDSQMSEIVAAVGGQRHTVRSHLVELERVRVVTTSHRTGERNGRWVTYSLDAQRWSELFDRLRASVIAATNNTATDTPATGNTATDDTAADHAAAGPHGEKP